MDRGGRPTLGGRTYDNRGGSGSQRGRGSYDTSGAGDDNEDNDSKVTLFYHPPQNSRHNYRGQSRGHNRGDRNSFDNGRQFESDSVNASNSHFSYRNSFPYDYESTTQEQPKPNRHNFEDQHSGLGRLRVSSGDSSTDKMMQQQGSASDSSKFSGIVEFLREFKPIECACCDGVMGFKHRMTGAMFCSPDCHAKLGSSEEEKSKSKQSTGGEYSRVNNFETPPVVNNSSAHGRVNNLDTIPVAAARFERANNFNTPPVKDTVTLPRASSINTPAVDSGRNSRVNNISTPTVKAVSGISRGVQNYNLGRGASAMEIATPARVDNTASQVVDAAALRKDKNPFIKNVPSPSYKLAQQIEDPAPNPAPMQKPIEIPKPAYKPLFYKDCKFSPNLKDMARVKVTFVYNLNKVQVASEKDEERIIEFHDEINKFFSEKKEILLTRMPINNEIVLAEYSGEFYRARVLINGEKRQLMFIDFGDYKDFNDQTKLYELTDKLKNLPVMSVCIALKGVQQHLTKKLPSENEKTITAMYYNSLTVTFDGIPLVINEQESYYGVLWLSDGKSLNEFAREFISKNDGDSKADIQEDLLCEFNFEYVSNTVETRINRNALTDIVVPKEPFHFSLDDFQTAYKVRDLALFILEPRRSITAIIGNTEDADSVYVAPIQKWYVDGREFVSEEAERFVNEKGEVARIGYTINPQPKQVFIIKWCPWTEVKEYMTRMKWSLYHKRSGPFFEQPCYNAMKQEKKRVGKWFRGFFRNKVSGDNEDDGTVCSWFCLIDEGPTIVVPHKYVYHIDGRLMVPPAHTVPVRILLKGVRQQTPQVHGQYREIFTPGMTIKFKVIHCSSAFGTSATVELEDPTEEEIWRRINNLKEKESGISRTEIRRQLEKHFIAKHDEFYPRKFATEKEKKRYFKEIDLEKKIEDAYEAKKRESEAVKMTPFQDPNGNYKLKIGVPKYLRMVVTT